MSRRRLDLLLVRRGLAPTRSKAQELIASGSVFARGFPQYKAATQVDDDCPIIIRTAEKQWVSRGAHKLIQGLDVFAVNPQGKNCLDVGASTGGFTEVLLERGARKVWAVDVGYGQLAWQIREDDRVHVMERTNARHLTPQDLGATMDLIVSDASFISLKLLLPALQELGHPDADWVLLVKPQFEAGRERVGEGVIHDRILHKAILAELASFIADRTSLALVGTTFSPIQGPKGNIEFLFHLRQKRNKTSIAALDQTVDAAHAYFQERAALKGESP
jgi:23S rRNA (cytidine1920-2'-O)/16S rRNA (cytidine1409-2'-O)-methyltransferase